MSELSIPIKRGTFVELRNAMVNICPIGRSCTYEERLSFVAEDEKHGIRNKMVAAYQKEFSDYGLSFAIGGQISIDIFPQGWDKTYCLRHLVGEGFKEIHFFGDKVQYGGNDYEIYNHPCVHGHAVNAPADTIRLLKEIFSIK